MKLPRMNIETHTAMVYLLFIGFWILFSDQILFLFSTDPAKLTNLQTYKGWAFVTASAILIYTLLKRDLAIQHQMDVKLHQTNQTLRTSQTQYQYLFENSPVPLWIYDMTTLKFLAVNDTAIRKYGYSRVEFLSMTLRDIRPAEEVPRLIAR